jgi:hypothetical protein
MNFTRNKLPARDALKVAGIDGFGRPAAGVGAVLNVRAGPLNRAQRRMFARMVRRGMVPT